MNSAMGFALSKYPPTLLILKSYKKIDNPFLARRASSFGRVLHLLGAKQSAAQSVR
jgi:hypothetical protein